MTNEVLNRQTVVQILQDAFQASERHIKERVMKRVDFPQPIRKSGRLEIYRRRDIEKWLGL